MFLPPGIVPPSLAAGLALAVSAAAATPMSGLPPGGGPPVPAEPERAQRSPAAEPPGQIPRAEPSPEEIERGPAGFAYLNGAARLDLFRVTMDLEPADFVRPSPGLACTETAITVAVLDYPRVPGTGRCFPAPEPDPRELDVRLPSAEAFGAAMPFPFDSTRWSAGAVPSAADMRDALKALIPASGPLPP